ncbi:hypothetical protein D3C85_1510300 [compost metagenome]
MIVHGCQVDTGLAGDQPQRGFSETFLREQLLGSIEDALYGFRLGHDYSGDKHLFETYVLKQRFVKPAGPFFG